MTELPRLIKLQELNHIFFSYFYPFSVKTVLQFFLDGLWGELSYGVLILFELIMKNINLVPPLVFLFFWN